MYSAAAVPFRSLAFARLFASSRQLSSAAATSSFTHFDALSAEWWREDGPMRALHAMNRLRVPWIVGKLAPTSTPKSGRAALAALSILDVGCGAGLLTEPLAKLGATVTGIDASDACIAAARARLERPYLALSNPPTYICGSTEELASSMGGQFDAVVASEVVEHVADKGAFVAACLALAKQQNGHLFFTTINKTRLSRLLAIELAENLLGAVPRGTHQWEDFVAPKDLGLLVERGDAAAVRMVHGMAYNPLSNRWCWIRDTSVCYALYATTTTARV